MTSHTRSSSRAREELERRVREQAQQRPSGVHGKSSAQRAAAARHSRARHRAQQRRFRARRLRRRGPIRASARVTRPGAASSRELLGTAQQRARRASHFATSSLCSARMPVRVTASGAAIDAPCRRLGIGGGPDTGDGRHDAVEPRSLIAVGRLLIGRRGCGVQVGRRPAAAAPGRRRGRRCAARRGSGAQDRQRFGLGDCRPGRRHAGAHRRPARGDPARRGRGQQDFVLKEAAKTTAFFNSEHERPVGPTFIFSPGVEAPEGSSIKVSIRVANVPEGWGKPSIAYEYAAGAMVGAEDAEHTKWQYEDAELQGGKVEADAAGAQRLPPAVRDDEPGSAVAKKLTVRAQRAMPEAWRHPLGSVHSRRFCSLGIALLTVNGCALPIIGATQRTTPERAQSHARRRRTRARSAAHGASAARRADRGALLRRRSRPLACAFERVDAADALRRRDAGAPARAARRRGGRDPRQRRRRTRCSTAGSRSRCSSWAPGAAAGRRRRHRALLDLPAARAHRRATGASAATRAGSRSTPRAFTSQNGTVLDVLTDWEGRERGSAPCPRRPDEAWPSRLLRGVVCEAVEHSLFQVVLTPHHDRAHDNHVHLELKPEVGWTYVR